MLRLSPNAIQKIAKTVLWVCGGISVAILLLIVIYILAKGLPAFDLDFLFTKPKGGLSGEGGISTVIVSTVYLIGLTMIILVPVGVGAAVYLTEYAPKNRITGVIRYGIEVLAGVPSIIFGLFGFALFVTALHFNFSILSGALTLVCLLLPTMIRTTEESIKSVPRSYSEGALALGATKWQTISKVVVPAAIPGIITATILCIGRAIGETACLYVTMGGASNMPTSLLSPGRTLALHTFYLYMETNATEKALLTAAVLMIVIIGINMLTNWLAGRFHAKMSGKA